MCIMSAPKPLPFSQALPILIAALAELHKSIGPFGVCPTGSVEYRDVELARAEVNAALNSPVHYIEACADARAATDAADIAIRASEAAVDAELGKTRGTRSWWIADGRARDAYSVASELNKISVMTNNRATTAAFAAAKARVS